MEILRDEYLSYMTSAAVKRPLFCELFGPLVGLEDEWRAQGASEDEIALTRFGFDYAKRHRVDVAAGGMFPSVESVVLEDTPEQTITRDRYGRKMKLIKKSATIPLPMEYPVTDWDTWLAIKPRYEYSDDRLPDGWAEAALAARSEGAVINVSIPGGFDEPRQLMGEEELCVSYYTQPDLIHDMLTTIGATAVRVLEAVVSRVPVDILSVHEDLAGKSGSLVGPTQIDEFIRPYYRSVWDLLSSRGAVLFQQDSDGNINSVIDSFREAGVNCFYPMEPAAGMDMVRTREKYGNALSFMGGIDKFAVMRGPDAIRAELEYKFSAPMLTGGVIFGLDHRIPNGVTIENYRYYVRTAREMLGLDPNPAPSWGRQAF